MRSRPRSFVKRCNKAMPFTKIEVTTQIRTSSPAPKLISILCFRLESLPDLRECRNLPTVFVRRFARESGPGRHVQTRSFGQMKIGAQERFEQFQVPIIKLLAEN